ncbi:hypothetical protein [Amycolatopsis sp. VC5-11]|uniref:hypothetical protein n=1 Tax=Amycolatopsis sp. VC5-11 TaxID=3120156 RepID=UPI00300B5477
MCVLLSSAFAMFLLALMYFWAFVLPIFSALVTCVAAGRLQRGDQVRAAAAVLTIPCTAAMKADCRLAGLRR